MWFTYRWQLSFILIVAVAGGLQAEEPAVFFRGLNLNGPAVVIDGHHWEGMESNSYVCNDHAFENQEVSLVPATDAARARMLRTSRYGGNRVQLTDCPPGDYTLFLYVWEDNNAETFSVAVNGRTVLKSYNSGQAGHWEKLGPFPVSAMSDRTIVVTSSGGAANFSGIELWQGNYDGLGAPLSDDELAFFEKRIRPLLANKCYSCHSADAKDLQGQLLVDSRATLRRGGTQGPAVVAGDVEHSLLIDAVRYQNEDLLMPPDEKLSKAEIADLEQWVKSGAPDPRSTATLHLGKQIDLTTARDFWSLKPIVNPPIPPVNDAAWPQADMDYFILAKLEEFQLTPAKGADKSALIRRAIYDLCGLPPTPQEVRAFLVDEADDAFTRVVERLMESPQYGERWGRHWLDVVRYADTAGDNSDYPIPQMHRYRDWVIGAFNRDLPYDEFVRDQIAGDLRGGRTDAERNQRLIATGYIANARRFGSRVDDYPQHLTIEDTIDNLGRCFLGMTISCARCHDHKFDPITNRDYYGLYGIFHSTRYPWPGIELDKRQRNFIPLVAPERKAEVAAALADSTKEQARLEQAVQKLKDDLKKLQGEEKKSAEQQLSSAEESLNQEYFRQEQLGETAYAVAEANSPENVAVQLKGDPARLGAVVPRRFLGVLGGQELTDMQVSGRAQLAEWILASDNPLPARVMVNRIWQHHFGRGLVPTPNDFGKQGQPPTHAELLDYLAAQFRTHGWSVKYMHRLIMNSRTYQQSSVRDPQSIRLDPLNEWLSGFPRRRLDAESLRDTLLAVGGNLDQSPAAAHPFPSSSTWDFTQHKPFKAVYETNHRSVYLMTQRIQRHPYLAIFDGADPSTSTAARTVTTTPLQALYLLNDPFVHEQSRLVAERVMAHSADPSARLTFAYELLFARRPSIDEQAATQAFLADANKLLHESDPWSERKRNDPVDAEAWRACIRGLFRLNEFVYLD